MNDQRGHMRFVGGKVYCPRAEGRVSVDGEHGAEFVCPGCGVRIPETRHHAMNPPRRHVRIEATKR